MLDHPQYELLSAYLDGELTAAEQAEIERLLATDPAAGRLLDELRSLSVKLQELPRQTVGEDLSAQVLRVAERRMLTEGDPGGATSTPAAPQLPETTFFRRFLIRRTVVWTSVAVAVAVMISINERLQPKPLADKQVARVTAPRDEETAHKRAVKPELIRAPGPPPTIQAAPDAVASNEKNINEKNINEKNTVADNRNAEIAQAAPAGSPTVEPSTPDASSKRHTTKTSPVQPDVARVEPRGAGMSPTVQTPAPAAVPAPANVLAKSSVAPAPAATAPPRVAAVKRVAPPMVKGVVNGASLPPGRATKTPPKTAVPAGPIVQVVSCDITAEADRKKAFDKLLEANGIASTLYRTSADTAAGRRRIEEMRIKGADLVYVEVSAAQAKAVLAGLAAQPELFLAVSVKLPQDAAANRLVREFLERRGELPSKSGAVGPILFREVTAKKSSASSPSKAAAGAPAPKRMLFVVRVARRS